MTADIHVPLLDLKPQYQALKPEIDAAMAEVIESQYFIMGPKVSALEDEIAAYTGAKHAIGCASGSDACLLIPWALDIGPGDEVICPSYTFFATGGSLARLGIRPVYVDIDPVSYNMDPQLVRDAAAKCTKLKAIMPVHLFGRACDMDAYLAIGDEFGVPIIEDAAQAIGSIDDTGAQCGTRGLAGAFSFFPTKNLGGFGDGGVMTTNDDEIADRLSLLRLHGGRPKYYHSIVGMNSRLDALQAAVLSVKLKHLEKWHAGRIRNADLYDELFHDAGARTTATPLDAGGFPLRTPHRPDPPARHIFNQYVIRVPAEWRDELRAHLREKNIGTEIYYPVPLHQQECFADLGYSEGDLPESERAATETIALPIYPELTREQIEHVATTINAFVEHKAAVRA